MRRISKYEKMVDEGNFNKAVVAKLQSKKFRAHVRRLAREAAKMNYDEHDYNDYYVSITFDNFNNQFDVIVRSVARDGRYFNDVEEFVIDAHSDERIFDAELCIREAEKEA